MGSPEGPSWDLLPLAWPFTTADFLFKNPRHGRWMCQELKTVGDGVSSTNS